jgi:hypothetical protein
LRFVVRVLFLSMLVGTSCTETKPRQTLTSPGSPNATVDPHSDIAPGPDRTAPLMIRDCLGRDPSSPVYDDNSSRGALEDVTESGGSGVRIGRLLAKGASTDERTSYETTPLPATGDDIAVLVVAHCGEIGQSRDLKGAGVKWRGVFGSSMHYYVDRDYGLDVSIADFRDATDGPVTIAFEKPQREIAWIAFTVDGTDPEVSDWYDHVSGTGDDSPHGRTKASFGFSNHDWSNLTLAAVSTPGATLVDPGAQGWDTVWTMSSERSLSLAVLFDDPAEGRTSHIARFEADRPTDWQTVGSAFPPS